MTLWFDSSDKMLRDPIGLRAFSKLQVSNNDRYFIVGPLKMRSNIPEGKLVIIIQGVTLPVVFYTFEWCSLSHNTRHHKSVHDQWTLPRERECFPSESGGYANQGRGPHLIPSPTIWRVLPLPDRA